MRRVRSFYKQVSMPSKGWLLEHRCLLVDGTAPHPSSPRWTKGRAAVHLTAVTHLLEKGEAMRLVLLYPVPFT